LTIDLQDGAILMINACKDHKVWIRVPWLKSNDLGPEPSISEK